MKKNILPFLITILLLVGCSSNKPSENSQKAIDAIVNYQNNLASKQVENNEIDNFYSFKIYEDKNTNYYLIEAYTPTEDKTKKNEYLRNYFYDIDNDKLTYYAATSDFDKKMDSGDYTVIYTSGKFTE